MASHLQNMSFSLILNTLFNKLTLILNYIFPQWLCEYFEVMLSTFPRDFRFSWRVLKVLSETMYYKKKNENVFAAFEYNARRYPNKTCIIFENENWTFSQVENYARRISRVFRARITKGDVVAIMMTNRAEHPCFWLGLSRLGVVSALINTNLKNKSLIHSIKTVNPKAIIFSTDLAEAIAEIKGTIDQSVALFCFGDSSMAINLKELINSAEPDYIPPPEKPNYSNNLLYIFTSGTTGLPKAAIFTHSKYLLISSLTHHCASINSSDIIYCSLPLYHAAGCVIGVGTALIHGGTVVIRKKFSASSFISDCIKYKCTVAQYIGEICRYILSTPEKPEDTQHNLRFLIGNGLRKDVWNHMLSRYKVPKIVEVYGSSEGNLTFLNTEDLAGSCGFIPRCLPFMDKICGVIIKIDSDGKIIRNSDGLCIKVCPGESGMMVGIIPPGETVKSFNGYTNSEANREKLITDILQKGDLAFLSGDIMTMDKYGFLYFNDRSGDTFRCKGENVSTNEVEDVLKEYPGIKDATVYGVEVGKTEGRVGMAAIVDDNKVNLSDLAAYLDKSLPKYAQPIFIRRAAALDLTGTFKAKKFNLQKEAFNPSLVKDPLYFRDGLHYVAITPSNYDSIVEKRLF